MTKRQLYEFDNEPLTGAERDTIFAAVPDTDIITNYGVLGGIYLGLTPQQLVHLRDRMVRHRGDTKLLVLAGSVKCQAASGRRGPSGGEWRPKHVTIGEPCSAKECNGVYEFEGRSIPFRQPETVEVFEDVFALFDKLPSANQLSERVRDFGDKVGIPRLNARVLRYTFPVYLAEQGLNRYEIGEQMGIAEGTREDINFSEQVGPYCRGGNPFVCSAECKDGTECERPALTGADVCARHGNRSPVCGALLDDGSRCQLLVSDPYELCRHHSDLDKQTPAVCGVELPDGDKCDFPVNSPNERCRWHSEDGPARCGAETGGGKRCRASVSSADARCKRHRGDEMVCGAETGQYVDGRCQNPVGHPDQRCGHHQEDD
jgi:hypothetical protein